MTEQKPQDSARAHLEVRGGIYDGMLSELHIEDGIKAVLEKRGETTIIKRNEELLAMLRRLPYEAIDDLKNLSLREIKTKYGLEGEQIDTEFLIRGIYEKTVGEK